MSTDAPPTRLWTTLGWAAYLACSWTWCIGMFLPILLARDFGAGSFAVFALPNVLGAAAMGWVLRRPGSAAALLDRHRPMVALFSAVTVAFQVYFLTWVLLSSGSAGGRPSVAWMVLLATAILSGLVQTAAERRSRATVLDTAGLTWVVSLGLLVGVGVMGGLSWPAAPASPPPLSPDLVWLAPVCALGFLFSPYLDATFLRAAAEQRDPRASFGLGFGVLFLAMIVGTLLYAGQFGAFGFPAKLVDPNGIVATLLAAHIGVQLGYTAGVHMNASPVVGEQAGAEAGLGRAWPKLAMVVAAGGGLVAHHFAGNLSYAGMTVGEVIYRGFMVFYGLVFPAYVWIVMIPRRGGAARGNNPHPWQAHGPVFVAAVLLALPAYWTGFIERQTWWLAVGVGVVLVARLVRAMPAFRPGLGAPADVTGVRGD